MRVCACVCVCVCVCACVRACVRTRACVDVAYFHSHGGACYLGDAQSIHTLCYTMLMLFLYSLGDVQHLKGCGQWFNWVIVKVDWGVGVGPVGAWWWEGNIN